MSERAEKIKADYWEVQKQKGCEVKSCTLWTATELFGKTEKTIAQAKFPGAKFWDLPQGVLVEYKNERELLKPGGIAKVKCF
jgi:hypothetical protein